MTWNLNICFIVPLKNLARKACGYSSTISTLNITRPRYHPFVWYIVPISNRRNDQVTEESKQIGQFCHLFSMFLFFHLNLVNNREAVDLRRYRAHYNVIVMINIAVYFSLR